MRLLQALCFPLRRPLRLAALALAQSLFLWLMIAAFDAAYRQERRPGEFEAVVLLVLLFGSALCNAFWLHSSSVASLQRVIRRQNSLAPLRLSQFRPRGIGPAITSLVLIVFFVLFLCLAFQPAQVLNFLGVMTPDEALSLITSHVLVIGPGTLVTLIFFVSLACHAAEDAGWPIDGSVADLFRPRRNLAATMRYLLRGFLALGITAIAFNRGLELLYASIPTDLGTALVDPPATVWWVTVIFAGCAVVHFFWHASLYLLANYVVETGASGASK